MVSFELDFDMTDYIKNPIPGRKYMYELYAVSNHQGTLQVGHYWSYAKDVDGNWREFDDAKVRDMEEDEVCTKNAYTLFYRLKRFHNENQQDL